MARSGALLAAVAAWTLSLARGLVFALSGAGAWLLGAPCLRRAYHAWLAGAVLLGPFLHPYADPHSMLANPRNFLSRTFTASAWGWTCILAGGFGLLMSYGATGRVLALLCPLARLAVGAGLQQAASATLTLVEELKGPCPVPQAAGSPRALLPHSPSPAHPAFLLTYCCLLLAEELAIFRRYLARGCPASTALRLVFLLGAVLLGLWNLLLLATAVHGPAPGAQALGAALATLVWHLTYRCWYRARWSPGRPAHCLLPPSPPP
uniref:Fat storage inducing transmembrane protein 1 n=1 Tax=Pelusios castaneus TaxID=367368 RepID=A0A8C8S028_9SAUR